MIQPVSCVMNYVHNAMEALVLNVQLVEMEPLSTVTRARDVIKHVKHAPET